ncbi:hypothetical protein T265_15773, partial [Opisthorchis viverrini]
MVPEPTFCRFTEKCEERAREKEATFHAYMDKYKYKKMVLYMDACFSGSIFQDILPSNVRIYATTSARDNEESYATFCNDKRIKDCPATEFSYAWITDSQY